MVLHVLAVVPVLYNHLVMIKDPDVLSNPPVCTVIRPSQAAPLSLIAVL